AVRALAEFEGVDAALLAEWKISQPGVDKRSEAVTAQARKAWRWIGEMEEIAASFTAAGLPGGFHLAAAELYRRLEGFKGGEATPTLSPVTAMSRRSPRRKSDGGRRASRTSPAPAKFKFGTAALKRDAAKRALKRA